LSTTSLWAYLIIKKPNQEKTFNTVLTISCIVQQIQNSISDQTQTSLTWYNAGWTACMGTRRFCCTLIILLSTTIQTRMPCCVMLQ